MGHALRAVTIAVAVLASGACDTSDTTGPDPDPRVRLTASIDSVFVGRTSRMVLSIPRDTSVITAGPVAWSLSDSALARVLKDGTIIGLSPGTVKVFADIGDDEVSATVRVVPLYVDEGARQFTAARGPGQNCFLEASGTAYCRDELADSAAALTATGGSAGGAFTRLSSSPSHSCGLAADNRLYCMGLNREGQFFGGTRRYAPYTSFEAVGGDMTFSTVATGNRYTCAARANDGSVYCSGMNDGGQTGKPKAGADTVAAPIPGALRATHLAAGNTHACAIAMDGDTYCWGTNRYGQLGVPYSELPDSHEPRRISTPAPLVNLVAGFHSCGTTASAQLYCWGINSVGQVGLGAADTAQHPVPTLVDIPGGVRHVAVNNESTCAVSNSGALWCWGKLPLSQRYRDAAIANANAPTRLAPGIVWREITIGGQGLCGTTEGQRVVCL